MKHLVSNLALQAKLSFEANKNKIESKKSFDTNTDAVHETQTSDSKDR